MLKLMRIIIFNAYARIIMKEFGMRKVVLVLTAVVFLACLFAVSASATTYYFDADGSATEHIFECEYDEKEIITTYSGSFAKTNEKGECISWYATDTAVQENGDIYITVKSFVTVSESYCTIDSKGVYRFKNGPTKRNIVSINFPNDNGITAFVDEGAYGFYTQTGDYLPTRSELLFAYFPNTWKDTERLLQSTTVLEAYFHKDASLTWIAGFEQNEAVISNVAFHDCCCLRKIVLPHGVEKFKDGGNGCVFRNCYNLKTIDLSNLTSLYHIGSHTFYGSGLEEIILPNSVKVIEDRAFEGMTNLKKIRLGANVEKMVGQSMMYRTNNIQYIYLSNTLKEASGTHIFPSDGNVRSVIFFTGTLDELEAIKKLIGTNNQGRINHTNYLAWDKNITDDQYVAKATEENKNYIVYNYGRCEAFFGGHAMSDDVEMQFTSYFEPIKFGGVCTNDGCIYSGVDESLTIGAIFEDYGYSVTEEPINGKHSMVQCYKRNQAEYDKYVAQRDSFEFGVVVSVSADPLNPDNSDLIDAKQTYVTNQSFIAHDFFDIGVVGIGENQTGVALTFCAYVIDNGEIFYLDDGETVKIAVAKSHSDLASKAE